MGEHVKTFLDAFLAGIVIGIGGVVYLGVENRIAGSLCLLWAFMPLC